MQSDRGVEESSSVQRHDFLSHVSIRSKEMQERSAAENPRARSEESSNSIDNFVIHATPSEKDSTSRALKWPDDDPTQSRLRRGSPFKEMREALQSVMKPTGVLSDKSRGDERGCRAFTTCITGRQPPNAAVPTPPMKKVKSRIDLRLAGLQERVDVQLRTLGDPTSATRSTRIPRESKRDETGEYKFIFNDECNAKSYIGYSANAIELGEFESDVVQGNVSLKKLQSRRCSRMRSATQEVPIISKREGLV